MSADPERSFVRYALRLCVVTLFAGAALVLAAEARRIPRPSRATGGPPLSSALHDRGARALDARVDACPVWSASGLRIERGL